MSDGWIPADWPVPDSVIAGTTTRVGGVSSGIYAALNLGAHVGDDPAAVAENRARFVAMCGLPREPDWLTQVHGTAVRVTAGPTALRPIQPRPMPQLHRTRRQSSQS